MKTAAKIFTEDGLIKAEGDIPDRLLTGYPAIGFQLIKSEIKDGVRVISDLKLMYVGISATPNADPSIKRIGEQ